MEKNKSLKHHIQLDIERKKRKRIEDTQASVLFRMQKVVRKGGGQ
jgi:hypothetical protein